VASLVASWRSARETAAVNSVPAYVVNGRYQLVTQSIKSIEGMAELIEELVRLP
jgi:thiol:disulfide interchange protein DsbA